VTFLGDFRNRRGNHEGSKDNHRPRYFGKAFTSIVTQGFGGGAKIVEYLDFVGGILGFNTVKGSCVTALDPADVQVSIQQIEYGRLHHPAKTLFVLTTVRL